MPATLFYTTSALLHSPPETGLLENGGTWRFWDAAMARCCIATFLAKCTALAYSAVPWLPICPLQIGFIIAHHVWHLPVAPQRFQTRPLVLEMCNCEPHRPLTPFHPASGLFRS